MKLVIDMPPEMWEQVKDGYVPLGISKYLKNGTPFRCVLDRIRRKMKEYTFRNERGAKYIFADRMNTIINEAESEDDITKDLLEEKAERLPKFVRACMVNGGTDGQV